MTPSAQVAHAVTALRNARATPSSLPEPASMTFLTYEDNGGGYHWTIAAAGGATLVQSDSFGSYEEAKRAARSVHLGASSASFEDCFGRMPLVDLPARRDAARERDRADGDRWLDEASAARP